tara:strand:- start:1296 stop:1436 length:141 start_codon:yes stop_codon:yes gene_type:complete
MSNQIELSNQILEKLDKKMEQLKGVGLSDIDIIVIKYAIELTLNSK